MTEPTTPLKALIIPNTGDLPGTWGSAAINPDMTAIDGMLGGVQTISLSAATTFTLSAPTGSITPGIGPTQSQNAVLKFSGALSGNALITLPLPGYYIAENNCTNINSFVVAFFAPLGGAHISLPPGEPCHVYSDGTDVKFVNMGRVGSYLDLAAPNAFWVGNCTVAPYLLCDGTVYSISAFPALGAMLGSTFGGNGASTFGVPDLRGRYRIPIDTTGTRITSAGSGISGVTLGAAGGDERLAAHTHANTLTDLGHAHGVDKPIANVSPVGGGAIAAAAPSVTSATQPNFTGITINNVAAGAGASGNIPPGMVAGITLIKT